MGTEFDRANAKIRERNANARLLIAGVSHRSIEYQDGYDT